MCILCYCCGVYMVIVIFIMYMFICIIRYLYLSASTMFATSLGIILWFEKECGPADDFL